MNKAQQPFLKRVGFCLLLTLLGVSAHAQTPQSKIGSLDLSIGGIQATVTPAQPVIPKNIASGVQVVVTQNGQSLTPAAIAKYLGGDFQIVGEFSGPGLAQTVEVPTTPSAPNSLIVLLPVVTTAGNYTLSNLRFVVNGVPLLDVSPSTITVKVIDQVLVTSVQTKPLTLDEIQAMGVVLGSNDYTGFQFTVGLQLSSQVVNISFPVVFDPQGIPVPQPISPPAVVPDNVPIPELPTIVPVLLQSGDGSGPPQVQLPDGTMAPVRIPSVLVIPGNVGYLKQFFSAQLYVTNGAPGGSNLVVDNVTGTIKLPPGQDQVTGTSDDPLSLPTLTSGPEAETMNILAPGPDGKPTLTAFNPGQTGQTQWTIRGDKEGYYTINFDINATLEGLPTGPVTLSGTATGGVLVRNPYFNMTFTVPGVVRKGELFNVFATVTNTSQVAANNLTVNFDNASTSGVTLVGGASPVIPTLNAGDSTTLTFQFQSLRTGQVVASYLNFDTQNGTTGNLAFTLGVYANGTPMSPDTLVLPSSVDNLPTDVVDAAMRVLGQAWSVANAASGTLPAGVIRTTRTVVTQKALALSEAGLRQSLGESLPNALRDLATDFFGGSTVDPGFDQVLRTTPAGQNFVNVLGAHLNQPMNDSGGILAYELQLAQVGASGPDFISFGVGSGKTGAPVSVTLTDGAGNLISSSQPGGSIFGGVVFPLGNSPTATYLGLVTSPTHSPYVMTVTSQGTGAVDVSISIPRGDGTVIRGSFSGVQVTPGLQMRIVADFTNPNNLVLQVDSAGDGSFATAIPLSTQIISPSGPNLISATVIGRETVSQAGVFGLNLVVLFDRIVDTATAGTVANYSIPNNAVLSASRQLSGRLVFGNLAQPEGPYVPTAVGVTGIADQRGGIGPTASVNLHSKLADPGAVVTGRVLGPDGTPSSAAVVTYSNSASPAICQEDPLVGVTTVPVQNNGVYQFRYVHQDQCGGPFQMATRDPNTGALRQGTAYVRAPGQQIVMDLAMLGLGSVTGIVTDLSGNPVTSAQVAAISSTDAQVGGSAFTDGTGRYSISGITVGPVNVTAVKGISLGRAAGNIERAGTVATINVTLNGGAVNATGTVTQSLNGVVTPVSGMPVVYYLTGTQSGRTAVGVATTAIDGSFAISGMPTGAYDVVAQFNSSLSAHQSGVAAAGDHLAIPLQIVIPTTGTVSGKVTLPNGSAPTSAVVYQNQTGVLANADGTYTLPGITVLPSQSQTIYARTQDGLRSGQTSVVVNSATVPVTGANITLSGLGSAQFTVLDASGNPVSGQKVTLLDGFNFGCGTISQTTNSSGIAIFNGLPIGGVTAAAVKSSGNFTDLARGTATITQDGTTGFATIQFHGAGTVTGTVLQPLPSTQPTLGAVVQLNSLAFDPTYCALSASITQSVQTDTSGNFRFTGVNVGPVGVTASQAFFPTQVGKQGTLSANGGTVNFQLQLVNTISGVLSGTVFLPDGTTPAGAGIQVTATGPLPDVTVGTDSGGHYKFAKIFPDGLYTLTATDPVSGGINQMKVYLHAGQDTSQDLRLKGTGTINVTVVDGAGTPVGTAFVNLTETDYPNSNFSGSLDASNQGVIGFPSVFEGGFSVQVTDPFGRGGRASGTLPQGTSSLNIQVQLTTTGTVQGHFFLPDGATPVPNASIQLTANGRVIGQQTTQGTGDVGSYSFLYVPAGPVDLKAQDPLTGRTGVAAGTITAQGQVLSLDVKAQGLDTVQGVVRSNGAPQPGASVLLVSGTFQATTTADANGIYSIVGVPEGLVVATASLGNGALSGTASTLASGDQNTYTLNVDLRSSGAVTGQVVPAVTGTSVPVSTITISVGGTGGGTLTTTTDAQGNFSFDHVPAGNGTITAQVLGGIDEGTTQVSVPAASTVNVQVKLNGIGSIAGRALDSSGNPTTGTIVLTGTGTFPYYLTLTAGADGTFSLPQVLAGPFTARLSANIGGFTLYGTATGNVTPNQTDNFTVQVQPSGTVRGLVLRPDGVVPAIGANVTIQLNNGAITLQAQNDGTFTATGVPLGSFIVRINDPSTSGLAFVGGRSLDTNGQTADLGPIVLDANALSVVSTNPADGAAGVSVTQALSVTFSEAVTGFGGVTVTNGGTLVPLTNSLSADGKTITLQGQLPDGVQLALNISSQVFDVFGRQLVQPQTILFTTADLTPPFVVAIAPPNQAIQVPVNSAISVTFNKALSTTISQANVIAVNGGSTALAGTTTLTAPNVLSFTPASALLTNTIYTVTVNGAVSFGGNMQTAAFTSLFVSPETTPPGLFLNTPANGTFTNNPKPVISLTLSDALTGVNPATASLILDGQPVTPSVSSTSLTFVPSVSLADGAHSLAASVQNNAGILGTLSASFTVDTAPPSAAALTGINAGQTLKGSIPISASATDATSGIAHINLLVDGVVQATLNGPSFSGAFDTARIPDGPHNFTVQAVNNAGTTGPASTPVQAFVENIVLTVSISSPANGAPFKGQVLIAAIPSEPAQRITFTLGAQTVTATASPYQGTLSLAGVTDGPQIVTVTAYDFAGDVATTTVTIVVMQTPPAAPNGNLIFAEPPNNGISLVHGLPAAVGAGGLLVTVTDTVSHATAVVTAASDGSFATNLTAAVNDTLSLTATDVVGNISSPTLLSVRSTPSLPPSSGNTSLIYQGNLVDRVGLNSGSLTPDGLPDAVFTLSLSIGNNVTRTLSYIDLQGGSLVRSTRAGNAPLGVASDVGAPLLNSPSGPVSFPITSGATLTLIAGDGGFIQPGTTYTAIAVFTDGSQFVGTFTIVAPADRQYVAHSATIAASPATVVVNGSTPGTATITITNIRDINGTTVPDGAMIALSAANMASLDPAGNGIVSAGGTFTNGTPATNNANFQVYTITNGTVTATFSSQPVTPSPITGALSVIQMLAVDSSGNVLGTQAVATLDVNIRASSDQAIVVPVPSELFGDRADRRSHFTIQVNNTSGNPAPNGTPVVVTATSCAALTPQGLCISSAGGQILGGTTAGAGGNFRLFFVSGGVVQGEYSSSGVGAGDRQLSFATIQVLASDANGFYSSRTAIGTASIALAGAGNAEVALTPTSVPFVFPAEPVTITIHHEHDMRANLAPDGSNILVSASSCAMLTSSGLCVGSAGGTITDGTASPSSSALKYYTLNQSQAIATYTVQNANPPNTGQSSVVNIQVQMADQQGQNLDRTVVAIAPLELLGPANAIGNANPASILGDGGIHPSTVTFGPVLDAFGNTLPDGSNVIASANSCAGLTQQGLCINSAGGQITNGTVSSSGAAYSVLTVQGGKVVANYADQGVISSPGQVQTANVVLLPADANGALVSRTAIGVVPVLIAGLTSGSGTASPASVYADGGDQRAMITISSFKDASGNPVPDGTVIGATAQSCATLTPTGLCISSAGGVIIGTNPASFNSAVQLFTIANGQVSFPYSAQGVSVGTGEQTAVVQIETVTPQGGAISRTAVATLNVQLLSLGSAAVAATPPSILADGADHQSQIVISNLVESDGVTPVPDGAKVGLTAANCAALTPQGSCVSSLGGTLHSAGTSPGDGTPAANNSNFSVFTVAGGKVQASYSDLNLTSGVNQTQTASVAVVSVDPNGNVLTRTSSAVGIVQLPGTTSATASGPSSISQSGGGTVVVTFSGIKDALGNAVPDGTNVAVTAVNCATITPSGFCNGSTGGTIVDGTTSPSDSRFKVFTVQGGSINVTYSPSGASVGTATVQVAPAQSNGTKIGNTSLFGGTWTITVTN